jgi:hypothetical protein
MIRSQTSSVSKSDRSRCLAMHGICGHRGWESWFCAAKELNSAKKFFFRKNFRDQYQKNAALILTPVISKSFPFSSFCQ